jgi:RNA chaperone Hfq
MHTHIRNIIESGKFVRIFVVNGFQNRFRILDCDDEKILVESTNDKKSLIYIHAISTIELD